MKSLYKHYFFEIIKIKNNNIPHENIPKALDKRKKKDKTINCANSSNRKIDMTITKIYTSRNIQFTFCVMVRNLLF